MNKNVTLLPITAELVREVRDRLGGRKAYDLVLAHQQSLKKNKTEGLRTQRRKYIKVVNHFCKMFGVCWCGQPVWRKQSNVCQDHREMRNDHAKKKYVRRQRNKHQRELRRKKRAENANKK